MQTVTDCGCVEEREGVDNEPQLLVRQERIPNGDKELRLGNIF